MIPLLATGVKSVRLVGESLPVYNLSVDGCPEFFAEGVLVHNCIADALAWKMVKYLGKLASMAKKDVVPVIRENTLAWRMAMWRKEEAGERADRLNW